MKNVFELLKVLRKNLKINWYAINLNKVSIAHNSISRSFQELNLALENWGMFLQNMLSYQNTRIKCLNMFWGQKTAETWDEMQLACKFLEY